MRLLIIKKIIVINLLVIYASNSYSQQAFKPVPDSLVNTYKYNLEKNFFQTKAGFNLFLNKFSSRVESFKEKLNKKATVQNLESLTQDLSELEYNFRKMDLYLFLQYATNTTNAKASVLEDSIYDIMLTQRSKYRNYIKATSQNAIKSLLSLPSMNSFQYYINNIITNKKHELSQTEITLLKSFNYLKVFMMI
jgi:oligoendopeptidase F